VDGIEVTTVPRILIAGTGSGCGKTMVTCGVLGALSNRKIHQRAFKCGPDYIDPMFHTKVLGVPSRNLDSFLCGDEVVKFLFSKNCPSYSVGVIEGVMGYYDGLSGTSTTESTHHIAQLLNAPVILVVDCKGKSLSLAAELQGYQKFAPNRIAGVILNRANSHNFSMYRHIVEEYSGLPVLGYLPLLPEVSIGSRHLGLVTAGEIQDLRQKMDILASQTEENIDIDLLLRIAAEAGPLSYEPQEIIRQPVTLPIAVARDSAFCFYYQDSLDLLSSMGAKLIPFSPLTDEALPEGVCGLLLGGGYPELYARSLSFNRTMLEDIAVKVREGLPTIAECGGFMLLCKEMITSDGEAHRMSGAVEASVHMGTKLSRFGYARLSARKDNLLAKSGEELFIHEFHYSDADATGDSYVAEKPNGRRWDCVHSGESLFAGYPHLHMWGNRTAALRFMERCGDYHAACSDSSGSI